MGCSSSSAAKPSGDAPVWDKSKPLGVGANKEVFDGNYKGKRVAVCVARTTTTVDHERIQHEIKCLERLKHPYIIKMLYNGVDNGRIYLALERVEPIGYDLDRLVNQYNFTQMQVPAALMTKLLQQLVSALGHMHSNNLVHRDLKTENVLITGDYDAKLIDMGIACDVGTVARLVAGYLAPEICAGKRIGPEADCWGLGLILHQTYQKQWKLLDAEGGRVKMRPGMPSSKVKMEKSLQEAMNGLLLLDVKNRWTLDKLGTSLKNTGADKGGKEGWIKMVGETGATQKFVSRFRTGRPPLTAFAAYISEKRTHIIGKTIGDIQIGSKTGAVILLVDYNGKSFEKCPSPSTQIKQGCWMYFGVHKGDEEKLEEAVESITHMLAEDKDKKKKDAPLTENSGRVVEGPSELLAFTLEFDSFTFPEHIGQNARLGPQAGSGTDTASSWLNGGKSNDALKPNDQIMMPGVALDMRNRFKINVAGVLRQGSDEPEWFPSASVEVSAGDLGIVVRKPNRDGSTESTVTDEELSILMDKDLFAKAMKSSSSNVLAGA